MESLLSYHKLLLHFQHQTTRNYAKQPLNNTAVEVEPSVTAPLHPHNIITRHPLFPEVVEVDRFVAE